MYNVMNLIDRDAIGKTNEEISLMCDKELEEMNKSFDSERRSFLIAKTLTTESFTQDEIRNVLIKNGIPLESMDLFTNESFKSILDKTRSFIDSYIKRIIAFIKKWVSKLGILLSRGQKYSIEEKANFFKKNKLDSNTVFQNIGKVKDDNFYTLFNYLDTLSLKNIFLTLLEKKYITILVVNAKGAKDIDVTKLLKDELVEIYYKDKAIYCYVDYNEKTEKEPYTVIFNFELSKTTIPNSVLLVDFKGIEETAKLTKSKAMGVINSKYNEYLEEFGNLRKSIKEEKDDGKIKILREQISLKLGFLTNKFTSESTKFKEVSKVIDVIKSTAIEKVGFGTERVLNDAINNAVSKTSLNKGEIIELNKTYVQPFIDNLVGNGIIFKDGDVIEAMLIFIASTKEHNVATFIENITSYALTLKGKSDDNISSSILEYGIILTALQGYNNVMEFISLSNELMELDKYKLSTTQSSKNYHLLLYIYSNRNSVVRDILTGFNVSNILYYKKHGKYLTNPLLSIDIGKDRVMAGNVLRILSDNMDGVSELSKDEILKVLTAIVRKNEYNYNTLFNVIVKEMEEDKARNTLRAINELAKDKLGNNVFKEEDVESLNINPKELLTKEEKDELEHEERVEKSKLAYEAKLEKARIRFMDYLKDIKELPNGEIAPEIMESLIKRYAGIMDIIDSNYNEIFKEWDSIRNGYYGVLDKPLMIMLLILSNAIDRNTKFVIGNVIAKLSSYENRYMVIVDNKTNEKASSPLDALTPYKNKLKEMNVADVAMINISNKIIKFYKNLGVKTVIINKDKDKYAKFMEYCVNTIDNNIEHYRGDVVLDSMWIMEDILLNMNVEFKNGYDSISPESLKDINFKKSIYKIAYEYTDEMNNSLINLKNYTPVKMFKVCLKYIEEGEKMGLEFTKEVKDLIANNSTLIKELMNSVEYGDDYKAINSLFEKSIEGDEVRTYSEEDNVNIDDEYVEKVYAITLNELHPYFSKISKNGKVDDVLKDMPSQLKARLFSVMNEFIRADEITKELIFKLADPKYASGLEELPKGPVKVRTLLEMGERFGSERDTYLLNNKKDLKVGSNIGVLYISLMKLLNHGDLKELPFVTSKTITTFTDNYSGKNINQVIDEAMEEFISNMDVPTNDVRKLLTDFVVLHLDDRKIKDNGRYEYKLHKGLTSYIKLSKDVTTFIKNNSDTWETISPNDPTGFKYIKKIPFKKFVGSYFNFEDTLEDLRRDAIKKEFS